MLPISSANTWPRWRISKVAAIAAMMLLSCVTLYSSGAQGSECPTSFTQSVNCSCSRIGLKQYDLLCPHSRYAPNSYVLRADIEENKYAGLSCTVVKSPSDLTLISGLNVGSVDTFIFKLCPLPDMSFREFMLSMGIKQINKLQIQMVSNFSVLESKHLEGLNEVYQLDISYTGLKELQEDLLKDLTNLQWLTLINNNINHLPKGFFKYLLKLNVLDLGSNNITYLEPGIFRNLSQLRLLNLWNNKIANLTRGVFSDTPNLEILDLRSNLLVTLTPDVFTDLVKLKNVNLIGNKISALPHGLFSSNPLLEIFTLTNNKKSLITIPQGLLSNLTFLKEVNLNNCNTTIIPKDLIWGSYNVTKVILSGNFLEELPDDIFKDSREVTSIDISRNRLKTLPNKMFVSTKKLKTLILHHNQLTHISSELLISLSALETLDFSDNKLIDVDSEAFLGNTNLRTAKFSNNLLSLYNATNPFATDIFGPPSPFKFCRSISKLYLANNLITQIFSDWQGAENLTILDLSHNKISYLEARDLHFRSKQKLTVDLTFNNISVINLTYMEEIAIGQYDDNIKPHYQNPLENHSARINLAGNPLQCDCRNYHLKKYFDDELSPEVKYIIDLNSYDLKCAGPEPLDGFLFSEIPSESLMCPLDKMITKSNDSVCPDKCSCFYRPINKGVIINCNKKNLTSLPDNFLHGTLTVYEVLSRSVNHTELDLSENYIRSLPKNLDEGFQKVTKLTLSRNNFTDSDFSKLSPNITVLKLDNNNMSYLDSESISFFREAHQLNFLSLYNNPWQCDCKSRELLSFIQNYYDKVYMLENVTCAGGVLLSDLTIDDICPFSAKGVVIASVTVAILGLITGILLALYYRYNQEIKVWMYAHQIFLWFVTEEELDRDKLYDAFISYSQKDEEYVIKNLVPGLEKGTPRFKLCLHYRDWIVGDYIPNQIARSVENSRRTIVILSPNFLDSVWGKMEFRTAHLKALSEGRARVIVILHGDIGPTDKLDAELKAYISMNTYIKSDDPWFWDRLRFALPHPPKPTKSLPLFQRNLARQPHKPVLHIDKDDLIDGSDPNATPPAATTPPANSLANQTPSFIPNGQPKLTETSDQGAKVIC